MESFTFVLRISMLVCYVATRLVSATIYLKPYQFSFAVSPARFAAEIKNSGICGALYMANPLDACVSPNNSFRLETDEKRFVLIVRGNCSFEDKVRNAQDGGFDAAIVYDDRESSNLVSMVGNSTGIFIHAAFISKRAGEFFREHARGVQGECCITPPIQGMAWTVLLISIVSLVVILSTLLALYFSRFSHLYWRRPNHHHASTDAKMVNNLPCFIFNSSHANSCHTGETCAICLEDYKDGENLRILPCQHGFHASCIDPWLIKWGTSCPVCKHNVDT